MRRKANTAISRLTENEEAVARLSDWVTDESIIKCRIAKYILEHSGSIPITRRFVFDIAGWLGVKYLYCFDADGNVIVTNSDYDRVSVGESSVFRVLLQGKPCIVEVTEDDLIFNENLLKVGMSLRDGQDRSNGMVLIMMDYDKQNIIQRNLNLENTFREISMVNGIVMLAVDDDANGDGIHGDKAIACISEVENGVYHTGLKGYDYIGHDVADLGIDGKQLQDHYEGNLTVLGTQYFASVFRDNKGDFIVAMQVPTQIGWEQIIPASVCAGALLFFVILMIPAACIVHVKFGESTQVVPEKKRTSAVLAERLEKKSEELLSVFGRMTDTAKPFFKDRWPRDAVKWKHKTQDMKFMAVAKQILIIVFLIVCFQARLEGENSIWYYCLGGRWDLGFNLHFFASSVVSISALFIFRILLHKILYLIARIATPKGETICHLLDSMASYVLFTVGIFICLNNFGVDTTALSLTGGIAGVIFGIGAQNVVNDILSGILMTFEGVVHVGELVFYEGNVYFVLSVGLRTTRLIWFGETTVIRNNDFKDYKCRPNNQQNRITTELRIELSESVERVEEILRQALPQIHETLCAIDENVKGPHYEGVESIGENWVVLFISCLCTSQHNKTVDRALQRELKLMCERNGIRIPVQQIVVSQSGNQSDQQ